MTLVKHTGAQGRGFIHWHIILTDSRRRQVYCWKNVNEYGLQLSRALVYLNDLILLPCQRSFDLFHPPPRILIRWLIFCVVQCVGGCEVCDRILSESKLPNRKFAMDCPPLKSTQEIVTKADFYPLHTNQQQFLPPCYSMISDNLTFLIWWLGAFLPHMATFYAIA